ncbi:MAG: hypothetical protein ACYTFW_11520 [Planctomycetota bacterium]|jgi:hypothetical protein
MMNKIIEPLSLGFSRLLCYSYGGFLLVVLAACISHSEVKQVIDALHPSLAILAIIVIGSAIYVLHRTIIIPIHHLLLCSFFCIGDRSKDIGEYAENTPSPTRFLGEALGVPVKKKITAYNVLRRSDFFPNKESLNIVHAENDLLIMSGVGLIIATFYAVSQHKSFALTVTLFALALVFLTASFWAEWIQHSVECLAIKHRPIEAMKILVKTGILRPEDLEAMIELSHLKDKEIPEVSEEDIARKEQTDGLDTTSDK